MAIYVVKCTFFWTSNFDGSPFLCQLRQERVIYLKRKPYHPLFERSFAIGIIFTMKGSKQILVKVVLFQLIGCGHPQGDAQPNFFLILKALYQGFQMRYHLFLKFVGKLVEIAQTFCLNLAIQRYMSTSVIGNRKISATLGSRLQSPQNPHQLRRNTIQSFIIV